MIRIQCDNCDRWFDAPDERAGGKMPCPSCGDVNRVPGAPAAAPATDGRERPAVSSKAAVSPRSSSASGNGGSKLAPGENELCVVRPGMFRAHPFRYALVVLLFIAGVAGVVASLVSENVWSWLLWPSLALLLGTAIWFTWWWITTHFWVRLVVTDKRTIRHIGIIKRHTTEVLHDHVRSVDIRQTFLERMLDVGTIGIDSAGQDGIEIEVSDIPHPYEIKKIIDTYRRM